MLRTFCLQLVRPSLGCPSVGLVVGNRPPAAPSKNGLRLFGRVNDWTERPFDGPIPLPVTRYPGPFTIQVRLPSEDCSSSPLLRSAFSDVTPMPRM